MSEYIALGITFNVKHNTADALCIIIKRRQ